jgi:hypothetical protein
MRKFLILCLASIPLLTGCDTVDSHHAREDQETLVGMSKADFYACSGLPNRTQTIDGFEYDTWDYQPYSSDSFTLPVIGGLSFGSGSCHATAIFKDDKVREIDYAGDTGGVLGHVAACETIVSHCENDMKPATGKY